MRTCKHVVALIACAMLLPGMSAHARTDVTLGEQPAITKHLDETAIESGQVGFQDLVAAGRALFTTRCNILDGRGRPASTGTGEPRPTAQADFLRTSGPEASSCLGCHMQPGTGGTAGPVANVFVGAEALDPATLSVDPAFSDERNAMSIFGSGVIEMLAREMSAELIAIRQSAAEQARRGGQPVTRDLVAKGVNFGRITVLSDGRVDPTEIEGVDWDLIVKPFHQKGAVASLRQFTNSAMNQHLGMQSMERFGTDTDPDADGVTNELTLGDLTALVTFQASLPAPRRARPHSARRREAARRGQAVFESIGCGGCHLPEVELDNRVFSEPNPYNPPGNLRPADVSTPLRFDLVVTARSNLVRPLPHGRVRVEAFTDLKRHDLNDADYDHFANEVVAQGMLTGFGDPASFTVPAQPRPTREFLTRKLWDAGNTDPYGHRGDLTTLTEAVYFHGGEARVQRDAYFDLPLEDRDAVIEFLKTLTAVPETSR